VVAAYIEGIDINMDLDLDFQTTIIEEGKVDIASSSNSDWNTPLDLKDQFGSMEIAALISFPMNIFAF